MKLISNELCLQRIVLKKKKIESLAVIDVFIRKSYLRETNYFDHGVYISRACFLLIVVPETSSFICVSYPNSRVVFTFFRMSGVTLALLFIPIEKKVNLVL